LDGMGQVRPVRVIRGTCEGGVWQTSKRRKGRNFIGEDVCLGAFALSKGNFLLKKHEAPGGKTGMAFGYA